MSARKLGRADDAHPAAGDVPPISFARVHLGLGEHAAALDWLETAYRKRNTNVLLLRSVPFYDPIRSEPRFQQLLARLKLPAPPGPV